MVFINIYDIANKAGVSIATVSRVLNNSDRVSEKTKKRIEEIMQKEGYVPNAFARGLGLNSMKMVGVMCTDVTDSFYALAVGHIEKLLRENGLDTVLCCTGNNLSDKKKAISELVNRKVDAIILIGSAFREKTDNSHIRRAAKSVPVEIINGNISLPGVYCIYCDERKATESTVKMLNIKGASNIVYIYDTDTYSGLEKCGGYRDGCKKLGLTERFIKTEKSFETVENTIISLIKEHPETDAVIASEDILAAAAQKALIKNGKNIPVIGFNNSVIAQCATPSLTSIDNMCLTMCETAVKNLTDLSLGKSVPKQTVISAKIEFRESFKED